MSQTDVESFVEKFMQEFRRGTTVLCVLSQLKQPQYGYSLVQALNTKGFQIEQNTLYPLLRRLENQYLLESHWDVNESRPRKYYVISEVGLRVFERLSEEWKKHVGVVNQILEEGD